MVRCLEIRNLTSRQDEVLSLTPNDSLFFIVQIVNTHNEQRYEPCQQSCHWLAMFFDEGLQQSRRCPPGCFCGEARIKETCRFRRLLPVAPTLDEIYKGSQLYLFVRKTLTGLFPPMGGNLKYAQLHRTFDKIQYTESLFLCQSFDDHKLLIERSIKYSILVLLSFVKTSILANPCFWWLLTLNYEHCINKLMYENGIKVRPFPARILEILRSSYQLRARRWPSLNE
jgi:hypothetical protein